MAEGEVNYASVVFKRNSHPPPQARKEEETVYDEVKGQNKTTEETAVTNGSLLEKKANNRRLQYQRLACCLGILCVILLLGIIAVIVVYQLATLSHQSDESGLMAANHNLTNLNKKLSLDNEKLRRDNNNLTVQLGNLTQNYTVLESKITNLTVDVQNLTTRNLQLNSQNQQLETQRNNLTKRIQDLEKNLNELNVSRAQWSIDAYCPKKTNGRQCKPCQKDWEHTGSNCYAYNNADPPHRKTWEEARQDCRGKGSDLVVVHNEEEKNALNTYSVGSSGTDGYWFGLRAEGGRWKWIDGSDLTSYWTPQHPPPAADGQCVMSVQNNKWISVSCTEKKQWICIMKALSV
ncbi:C-type lectin domain family 10 member A-like isoform X2 [Perca fluviatilis]|uniref:C-type lectin domain family 10 member A-like isoform X2 n=1 Tax=Perca fluviatilis TaxID=8168 RepID=UPI0019638BEF|nr:C-type lectin domain family 10 member A-like isoform X2 [Perca fluviatilis]